MKTAVVTVTRMTVMRFADEQGLKKQRRGKQDQKHQWPGIQNMCKGKAEQDFQKRTT